MFRKVRELSDVPNFYLFDDLQKRLKISVLWKQVSFPHDYSGEGGK